MKITENCVLITGGASGIGFALAEELLRRGNEVIICGRREEKLREARRRHRKLAARVCDLAHEDERLALCEWVVREFPQLNVLLNNAGIQLPIDFVRSVRGMNSAASEIAVNLEAPIRLSSLLLPHLKRRPEAAIVNVTSALAFVPLASVPVYSATKAALHSFTLSLRHQLRRTSVEVIEIVPPIVDTELYRRKRPSGRSFGMKAEDAARIAVIGLARGDEEIIIPPAEALVARAQADARAAFRSLNGE